MQGQIGHQLLSEKAQTKVLNNQGINLGRPALHQQFGDLLKLIGENQHVQGEKALDTSRMQPIHHFGKVLHAEIFSTQPGVEEFYPEINSISSTGDGSLEGVPIACRCQEFGSAGHR